jgi:multicomponent Na+:H+ antiporter subunit D
MLPVALLIVAVPLVAAIPALALRGLRIFELPIAVGACLFVILLLALPAAGGSTVLAIGSYQIELNAPLTILGRTLRVRDFDRYALILIFSAAALIFPLSVRANQGWTFVPLGLAMLSALSVALMIRPFVFSALALEVAASLAAMMIQVEREEAHEQHRVATLGALRFLTIVTLALPCFLGAGYVVAQAAQAVAPDAAAYAPAVTLLLIGFALLLGALPIFTWTHPVARDAPPLVTAFLATVYLGAITFLFLSFRQEYEWFRASPLIAGAANLRDPHAGLGGLTARAQRRLRVMACGWLSKWGVADPGRLGTVRSRPRHRYRARAISFGLLALACQAARQSSSDEFDALREPGADICALAIGIGGLSLAGLPGTIGFVSRWMSIRSLALGDQELMMLSILASASVGIAVVRGLGALLEASPTPTPEDAPATLEMEAASRLETLRQLITDVWSLKARALHLA